MREMWTKGIVLLAALALVGSPAIAEWPLWRGAGYDGVSAETGLVDTWSPEGENLAWKAEFIGRSTPVVFDGRACVIGRVGEGIDRQEIVACYDAASGDKLWEDRFNVYNTTVPFNRVGWASLAGDPETGNVYAHGVAGQIHAYGRDGKLLWSHFAAETFGRYSGYGGRTQTPVVEGDLLILTYVSANWGEQAPLRHRVFAFDKRTGEVVWIATPGGFPYDFNTQSAPVIATLGGKRVIVHGNADGSVYALDVRNGETVWKFRLSKRGINSTPLAHGNRVCVSHSEENIDAPTMGRVVAIDGTGTGDVTGTHEVWRSDISSGFPSPTFRDGRLYVVDNSANLHAMNAGTGETVWTHNLGTVGKASPVWADGKLYVAETNGRFHILKPGAEACTSLDVDELTVADGRYAEIYGSPAVAYGRVYFATEGGVYALGKPEAKAGKAKRAKSKNKSKASGSFHVVPAEVLAAPGEPIALELRVVSEHGRMKAAKADGWSLEGLNGTVGAKGRFVPAGDSGVQTGKVVATVGGKPHAARIRVIPELPWSEDFSSLPAGKHPGHWVGAARKFIVGELDGEKLLTQPPRERGLQRSITYLGPSDWTDFTIQADAMGTQAGRRRPDMGLIGGGYTIDLQGNHQRIQIRSWASEFRMATQVDFPWEMGTWYTIKMRVEQHDGKAVIRGKVWPRGEAEPEAWSIVAEDPHPIAGGSPGIVGYAPATVYYDNLKVMKNEG